MSIYVRVVERGSIASAARDLGIGHPIASECIERFEKYLGCRLLLRSALAFYCSPDGIAFYERSKRILSAVEQAVAKMSSDEQAIKGAIRIVAPPCFGESVVSKTLAHIRAAYRHLELELVLNDRIVYLVTEGGDISFRVGSLGEVAFIARRLGRIGRTLVAAPSYLGQHESFLEPADLGHSYIRTQGAFSTAQVLFRQDASVVKSASINTALRASHWRPGYEIIFSGVGIGALDVPACVDALADGRLVRILPQYEAPSFELNLPIQPQRLVPPPVRAVVTLRKTCVPRLWKGSTAIAAN